MNIRTSTALNLGADFHKMNKMRRTALYLTAVYGRFGDGAGPGHGMIKIPHRYNYHGIVNLVLERR